MSNTAPRPDGSLSSKRRNQLFTRDLLEVTIVFALILMALWSGPFAQKLIGIATFCWIVISTLRSQTTADSLGLGLAGIRRSLWIVCAALLVAALVIWIASRMHTLHVVLFHGFAVESSVLAYMLWALVQQFILQDFFMVRLLRLLPTRTAAVIVAATLFAIAHLPNSFLMVVTLIWGIAACTLFLRYRNLYSLGVAHGIMGLCLAIAIPNAVHHQMRVGLGYFRWEAPVTTPAVIGNPAHEPQAHRNQIDHIASTDAWVTADATSRRSSRHARP